MRRATSVILSAILSVIMVATAPVCGADPGALGRAGISPVVSAQAFERLGSDLGLTESQMMISSLLFKDYMTAMDGVLRDLEAQRAQDQARLDDALRGRAVVTPEELRSLRIRLLEATVPAWAQADRWRTELIESVQLISSLSQARQQAALARFDLAVFGSLGNRHGLVDLSAHVPDDLPPTPGLDAALRAYRDTMGARIQDDALHARSARLQDDIAAIEATTAVRVALQRESSERWLDRMVIHDQFVMVISGLIAESSGSDDDWQQRAREALFPGVWSSPSAFKAAQWVIAHGNAAQAAKAQRCIDEGRDRLTPVRMEAVDLLRAGRRQGVDLADDAAAVVEDSLEIRMQYLRNTGERSVLEQDISRCVMADLTDGQRAAVRRMLMDQRTSD